MISHTQSPRSALPLLVVAALVAALAGWSAMPQAGASGTGSAASVPGEDWHGNVRRSHWTP